MILGIFIVDDKNRNKGIGKEAIDKAIEITQKRILFNKIRLNVRMNNVRAINCYKKCNFKICGTGKRVSGISDLIEYYSMELTTQWLPGSSAGSVTLKVNLRDNGDYADDPEVPITGPVTSVGVTVFDSHLDRDICNFNGK